MEDSKLLKQISCGDKNAFKILLDKYQVRVYRYFMKCFQDSYLAEDLCQSVFMIILKQLPDRWHQWHYFSRYLFKICKNFALKEAQKKSSIAIESIYDENKITPHYLLEKKEIKELVYQSIAKLSILEKQAVILKFIEGFSLQEIAEILELPTNTVKSHIFRAKKKMRQYLLHYEDF